MRHCMWINFANLCRICVKCPLIRCRFRFLWKSPYRYCVVKWRVLASGVSQGALRRLASAYQPEPARKPTARAECPACFLEDLVGVEDHELHGSHGRRELIEELSARGDQDGHRNWDHPRPRAHRVLRVVPPTPDKLACCLRCKESIYSAASILC